MGQQEITTEAGKCILLIKEIKDVILHLLVCLFRSNVALDCLNNLLESCPRII